MITSLPFLHRPAPAGTKFLALAVALLLAAAAFAPGAFTQATSGSLEGVVRDASGNTVAEGFVVRIRNAKTGRVKEVGTSPEGVYSFSYVEPGAYTIAVVPPGAADDRALTPNPSTVQVSVGQRQYLDLLTSQDALVEAAPGAAANSNTSIQTPTARSTRLQRRRATGKVDTAAQGATFTEQEIDRSPDNNQRFSRLAQQTPGAVDASGVGPLQTTFNGVRRDQNVVLIDGADASSPIKSLQTGDQEGIAPYRIDRTIGNIQEFFVAANTYSSVFGTGSGAQVVAITKTGGEKFQGTLFENFRNSALNARNFFDTEEPPFQQNVFGARFGGPIYRPGGHFFYVGYEGARARPGYEIFEAVPSAAARARAVPSIRPVLDAFVSPAATVVHGASTAPADFDIVRLVSKGTTENNAFDVRLDFKLHEKDEASSLLNVRFLNDRPTTVTPEGVSGRQQVIRDTTRNLLVSHNHTFSKKTINEFRFYANFFTNKLGGRPPAAGEGLSRHAVVISGSAPYSNSPQLPLPLGIAVAGGLLRQNASGFDGSLYFFKPRTFAFVNQVTRSWEGSNKLIVGGEVRFLRTGIDRLNGTTYTFGSLEDLLQNRLESTQFVGDLGAPSPAGGGTAPEREARQEYYIGFVQDEWRPKDELAFNFGLRYEYYSVVRERLNRNVIIDPTTGAPLPTDTAFFKSPRNNFMPRVAVAWAPVVNSNQTGVTNIFPFVLRANFGIHTGPKALLDQIQPIENDRVNFTTPGGAYPAADADLIAGFFASQRRQYLPAVYAPDYNVSDRLIKYEVSFERVLGDSGVEKPKDQVKFVVAYVGNTSRQLLVRGFTNRIVEVQTNPDPTQRACVRRQFDTGSCGGTLLQPFGELELRSSNGRSRYDALQLTVDGKWTTESEKVNTLTGQYTLARNYGNTGTTPVSNPFNLDDDFGYNADDARHVFSLNGAYTLPFGDGEKFLGGAGRLTQALLGDWSLNGTLNLRTGKPIDVRITRPDVIYVDDDGLVYGAPAAGRRAFINTPGGGAVRGLRRPDLITGVSPYLDNDRAYLNPAAFAIPAPGSFGNLRRGQLRGPGLKQLDLSVGKKFNIVQGDMPYQLELRAEVFNVFNTTNFRNPYARLPNALGVQSTQLQPGRPYGPAVTSANVFGLLNSTERYKDLGGSRQVQFRLLIHFNGGIKPN